MERSFDEQGIAFECEGETLIGVITRPKNPASRGLLIVVGGPQYRVGSHRSFVLLARHLARQGIPCMRFDYRGMGDSSGALRNFEDVGTDIRAAMDCFFANVKELREVVLWGLCDGATASTFYAYQDARVGGLALLNPWVRTATGEAKAYLKHYYGRRILDATLWKKVLAGRLDLKASLKELTEHLRRASSDLAGGAGGSREQAGLPQRMLQALERYEGRVLLILSGNDLTAKECLDLENSSVEWQAALRRERVTRFSIGDANHTFSSRAWRERMFRFTSQWIASY